MKKLFLLLLLFAPPCWAIELGQLVGRWEGFSTQISGNHHLVIDVLPEGDGLVKASSLQNSISRINATFSKEDFKYRGGYIEIALHSSEFGHEVESKIVIFGEQLDSMRATLILYQGGMMGLAIIQNCLIEKRKDSVPMYKLLEQIENATNK
ncbi:hypothetical protein WNY58_07520 [Neptuniibacter pectenicola]|uniref:DUF2147 domain-containing protein n=1 Tax=Neptuniibacter pectenicola TaxID=1806669 RepID=A0ABU9TRV4_9GAMM